MMIMCSRKLNLLKAFKAKFNTTYSCFQVLGFHLSQNLSKLAKIRQNLSKLAKIYQNVKIRQNLSKLVKISQNLSKRAT